MPGAYDLHSNIKLAHSIAPAAHVGDTTGATVDTDGFESIEFTLQVGVAMAGGGFTCEIQQAVDAGGSPGVWVAVPAADLLGGSMVITIADANKVYRQGSVGKERFQRLVLTETDGISGGVVGSIAILSNPRSVPTAAQAT